MNQVSFAEKLGCTEIYYLVVRDHEQKRKNIMGVNSKIDSYQKAFSVMDAHRLSKQSL